MSREQTVVSLEGAVCRLSALLLIGVEVVGARSLAAPPGVWVGGWSVVTIRVAAWDVGTGASCGNCD